MDQDYDSAAFLARVLGRGLVYMKEDNHTANGVYYTSTNAEGGEDLPKARR
jgi:hypothetical protein